MKPTGFWKIKEVLKFNDQFERVWTDVPQLLDDPETDDSDKRLLSSFFDFRDDGIIAAVMPLPEGISQEEIDQAVAEGELELYGDGLMCYEKYPWKFEDGKISINTGAQGEILGEAISPWMEIPEDNGILTLFSYHLIKS